MVAIEVNDVCLKILGGINKYDFNTGSSFNETFRVCSVEVTKWNVME
jgi:hypothetical protein